jgi:hypothetical protein
MTASLFFKRPIEFQTLVLGGGEPGKRIFCGIHNFSEPGFAGGSRGP